MEKTINFLKYKYIALGIYWAVVIVFIACTMFKGGFNYGIDFVGGYKVIAKFQDSSANEGVIRKALADFNPTVQKIGEASKNQFIITTKLENTSVAAVKSSSDQTSVTKYEMMKKTLNEKFSGVIIDSEETVGPAIGEYLRKSAWKLTLMAILMMSIYLAFRFEVKYAVGGMISLVHDMVMSISFCGIMGVEINVQILAALLTLYGYSINDTIVIFDRIRETDQIRGKTTFEEVINKAITQTLTRTLLTGITTLFAVLVLFLIGGEALHEFSLVLLFGILAGTFSSIYIASPFTLWWERWRAK